MRVQVPGFRVQAVCDGSGSRPSVSPSLHRSFSPSPPLPLPRSARLLIWLFVPLILGPSISAQTPQPSSRPAIAGRRVVKHFDFEERPLGNYEPSPMFWQRHRDEGFPPYLEGQFDTKTFHAAAPSFRLDLNGGSIAFEYAGGDIAVRTRSDYLVTAWIRTTNLTTARAYLTACYLDRKKNPIPNTQVRSALIGGPGAPADWQPVTIGLPGNTPGARYIGLTMWLTQERVWNDGPRLPRAIDHENVEGSAWFDDLTVYRLPRVTLACASPGQAFSLDKDAILLTDVSDPDGLNLTAKLSLHSADGKLIDEQPVPLQPQDSTTPHATAYHDLPLGLYHAELLVTGDDLMLVRRELSFLRYPGVADPPPSRGRGFGITLRDTDADYLEAQVDLLRRLGVEYVKLPVWNPRPTADQAERRTTIEKYLEAISSARVRPIGLLADNRAAGGLDARSMLDILSGPPTTWKPLIASDWAQFAGLVTVWQVGHDRDEASGRDNRLQATIDTLRNEMSALMSSPLLATTARVASADAARRPADFLALLLPASIPPDEIEAHLQPPIGADARSTWITVEAPALDAYAREPRLADLARRLVEAVWQQPAAVFLDAPWEVNHHPESGGVELNEDFIIFNTIATFFGETVPVARFNLDSRARCILFDRGGRAVMLVWDPEAPADGREYVLPLGEDARQLDLWGRDLPIAHAGQQRALRINPMPSIVLNAPTWLMDFRRHFAIRPGTVEASLQPTAQEIVFRNTSRQPINGVLSLTAPPHWELRPSKIPFSLAADEEFRLPIALRFPLNTPADLTPLIGEFELEADRRYHFAVPAWFEVGLKGVDLETFAHRTGDRATLRLTLTNRTNVPIHFEAHLLAPGRERAVIPFTNTQPNQPITKTFALDRASELSGRSIRLTLKELQGPRVWNRIITVP